MVAVVGGGWESGARMVVRVGGGRGDGADCACEKGRKERHSGLSDPLVHRILDDSLANAGGEDSAERGSCEGVGRHGGYWV